MGINEEYRWNVPVITYGFDKSFEDYFGSNGIAAVESAIQILNDLPAASGADLANFDLEEKRFNFFASSQHLHDLKSAALTLLLEHMGLAPAGRNVFDLRQFDPILLFQSDESSWPPDAIPNLILERNYDPETLLPSHSVNENLYTGFLWGDGTYFPFEVVERVIDPLASYDSAVTEARQAGRGPSAYWDSPSPEYSGAFDSKLTRDDIGGLRYLLSSNNVNLEALLPDVRGAGSNLNSYVDHAMRPGIEKITFLKHPTSDNGAFGSYTNQYLDTYLTNGLPKRQTLQRILVQPDILFSAATFAPDAVVHGYSRTGTSNWWNSATASATTNTYGPGVIRPPVVITFEKRGAHVYTTDDTLQEASDFRWGSYDFSLVPPIAYPISGLANETNSLPVHLHLFNATGADTHHEILAPVPFGSRAILETSPDLANWSPIQYLDPITNVGGAVYWDIGCSASRMFFRVRRE
jgi:hypothetical protein